MVSDWADEPDMYPMKESDFERYNRLRSELGLSLHERNFISGDYVVMVDIDEWWQVIKSHQQVNDREGA